MQGWSHMGNKLLGLLKCDFLGVICLLLPLLSHVGVRFAIRNVQVTKSQSDSCGPK